MRRLALLLCAALLLSLSGCFAREQTYSTTTLNLFDTVITVTAVADTQQKFDELTHTFNERATYYDHLFDGFEEHEGVVNIATLNRTATQQPVAVTQDMYDFLLFCKQMYTRTNGEVNVAFGAVTALWNAAREQAATDPAESYLPTEQQLKQAATHTDISTLVLNEQDKTVHFADPMLQLDVGAVAKGYAAQKLAEELKQSGYNNVLLSMGGNVVAIGDNGGEPWTVGIENPRGTDILHKLQLHDGMSVTVSGDYQRYFVHDGVIYHHIIDSDTLFPSTYYASCVVVAKDSGVADALSTALFNMPQDTAVQTALQNEVSAMFVYDDGQVEYVGDFG